VAITSLESVRMKIYGESQFSGEEDSLRALFAQHGESRKRKS